MFSLANSQKNYMDYPLYDLHAHTTASDGSLSPDALISRAQARGIKLQALTDHDTVRGLSRLNLGDYPDINVIAGTELTCLWSGRVLHVVGLNIDINSDELKNYLDSLNNLRVERARKISRQLVRMGLPDLFDKAAEIAGDGIIGRPHFAKAIVESGRVVNIQQAFKKYLGSGKKGDVKMEWPSLEEAVDVIRKAGGVSIIAHPTKYKMTFTKLRAVVSSFVAAGGDGIEVSYPGVKPEHHMHLLRIAKENNLLISAGSDFHSPENGWTDIGKFPPLKSIENHVLSRILPV